MQKFHRLRFDKRVIIIKKNNIDLSNQKFGMLTVIKLDEDKNKNNDGTLNQGNNRYWVCKCDCGNIKSIRQDKLIYGRTESCGCFRKDRKDKWTKEQDEQLIDDYINDIDIEDTAHKIGRTISAVKNRIVTLKLSSTYKKHNYIDANDIIGQKFGKLTVKNVLVNSNGMRKSRALYECDCDCGRKNIIVPRYSLLMGLTKSCGCLKKENLSLISRKDPLKYINHENEYYECILGDGSSMYFDYEDYDIVCKFRWVRNADGYITASEDNTKKSLLLHRLIMNKYYDISGLQIDHIRGEKTRNDNRKSNLRVVTASQNRMNVGIKKNNKSGVTGVSWSNYYNVWVARITKNGRTYCLGNFTNFDDAVLARKKAEEKYFGEYSYGNSQSNATD